MEQVIRILMLFILLNSLLKLSFLKWYWSVSFGLVCAAFLVALYPAASMQSSTELAAFMGNRSVMQDLAVLVTLEASVSIGYCFLYSRKVYGGKLSKWGKVLQCYVSILVFPVLFYLLTLSIFSHPGIDFATLGWIGAATVLAGYPLLRSLIRVLLPEEDFRLEIHFLVSLFVCALGLIATVNGNVTYAAAETETRWPLVAAAFAVFAITFAAGFFWNRLKWARRNKLKNNLRKLK